MRPARHREAENVMVVAGSTGADVLAENLLFKFRSWIFMSFQPLFRSFLVAGLLSALCSGVVLGSGDARMVSDGSAPEVSAEHASGSFRDVPQLESAFIDVAPAKRADALLVGELGVDGGNRDLIVELAHEIADGKHGRFDSLLIAHKGKLVFESYYLRGRVDLPHPQASATKAYLSFAVGRAIELGYLSMADLQRPVVSFLEDLDPTKFVEGAEEITLHGAMTMSSGLQVSRDRIKELSETRPDNLNGQREIQAILQHSEPVSSANEAFDYKFTDPSMVMQVLESVVPGSAREFIDGQLLAQLQIKSYAWADGFSGLPEGNHSSSMASRDMVKWGALAMNGGKWNGEVLISQAFVSKATDRIVHINAEDIFFANEVVSDPGYGYYWWQADLHSGDRTYFSRSAQGGGGQYIILVDELELLIVTTGHDREVRPLRMTAERIIPAFLH